jgi:AraC-like DNA-binding protein
MDESRRTIFSTDSLPQREKFMYWSDVICKTFNPIAIDSPARENFNAKIDIVKMGDAAFCLSQGNSFISAHRNRQLISRADSHSFHLIMKLTSGGSIKQGKREAEVRMGDLILVDTNQNIISTAADLNAIIISIPQVFMRTWIPFPEDCVAQPISGNKGWASVLSTYLLNLNTNMIATTKQSQHQLMIEHIVSLYVFALEEAHFFLKPDPLYCNYDRAGIYSCMYNWLKENYMNPELSVIDLAHHFMISPREVHRQFSLTSQGSTFLSILRAMRMAAAVRMLKDPKFSVLTVAEIGYRCGFNDSAYFGKVFRRFLGSSPGAFTKAQHREI